jgi:hypothetical protein
MSLEHLAFVRSQTNSLQNSLGNATSHSSEFQAMQNHLCQILAHYVVYIGSRLHLPIANDADRFILEAAPKRWHKEGIFRWLTPSAHGQQHESFLPQDIDADCSGGTLCAHSKTNGIFTLNRAEFQNAILHQPSFSNSVDGSSWSNILDIPTPELGFGQSNSSSSTKPAQSLRSFESTNNSLVVSLRSPCDFSSKSRCGGNSTKRLWNTPSLIGYQSFRISEYCGQDRPVPCSRTHIEGAEISDSWEKSMVDECGFVTLESWGPYSERERARLEETQNLLV